MSQTITRKVAQGAIDIIKQYGWKQGSYGTPEQGFCTIAALSESAMHIVGNRDPRSWEKIYVATCKCHPWAWRDGKGIPEINDRSSTTEKDAIAALESIT